MFIESAQPYSESHRSTLMSLPRLAVGGTRAIGSSQPRTGDESKPLERMPCTRLSTTGVARRPPRAGGMPRRLISPPIWRRLGAPFHRISAMCCATIRCEDVLPHGGMLPSKRLLPHQGCSLMLPALKIPRLLPGIEFLQGGLSAPAHAGILVLQPLEQFARCPPRFGLERFPQLSSSVPGQG